jgi:hypothetical protein
MADLTHKAAPRKETLEAGATFLFPGHSLAAAASTPASITTATHMVTESPLLARLRDFLPALKAANERTLPTTTIEELVDCEVVGDDDDDDDDHDDADGDDDDDGDDGNNGGGRADDNEYDEYDGDGVAGVSAALPAACTTSTASVRADGAGSQANSSGARGRVRLRVGGVRGGDGAERVEGTSKDGCIIMEVVVVPESSDNSAAKAMVDMLASTDIDDPGLREADVDDASEVVRVELDVDVGEDTKPRHPGIRVVGDATSGVATRGSVDRAAKRNARGSISPRTSPSGKATGPPGVGGRGGGGGSSGGGGGGDGGGDDCRSGGGAVAAKDDGATRKRMRTGSPLSAT